MGNLLAIIARRKDSGATTVSDDDAMASSSLINADEAHADEANADEANADVDADEIMADAAASPESDDVTSIVKILEDHKDQIDEDRLEIATLKAQHATMQKKMRCIMAKLELL